MFWNKRKEDKKNEMMHKEEGGGHKQYNKNKTR